MIKTLLILSFSIFSLISFSGCKGTDSAPKRTYVHYFEDNFDSNIYWQKQDWQLDSVTGISSFVNEDFNVNNSTASLSAWQGEGCERKRLLHGIQNASDLNYLINFDTIYVKIDIEKSMLSASGSLNLSINIDTNQIEIYIPEFDVKTPFEFKIHKWKVYETENSQETLIWNSSKNTLEENTLIINANACGADLYAEAEITIDHITIGYYELLVLE